MCQTSPLDWLRGGLGSAEMPWSLCFLDAGGRHPFSLVKRCMTHCPCRSPLAQEVKHGNDDPVCCSLSDYRKSTCSKALMPDYGAQPHNAKRTMSRQGKLYSCGAVCMSASFASCRLQDVVLVRFAAGSIPAAWTGLPCISFLACVRDRSGTQDTTFSGSGSLLGPHAPWLVSGTTARQGSFKLRMPVLIYLGLELS